MSNQRLCFRLGLVSVLVAAIAACSPSTKVMGMNKLPDYNGNIKRLFVLEAISGSLGKYAATFQQTFAQTLAACGVESDSAMPNALALDNEIKAANSKIAAFHPDATLLIQETGHSYMSNSGATVSINYLLTLVDVQQKRTVWKETINFIPKMGAITQAGLPFDSGAYLAFDIIDQMSRDGVMQACPTPQR